MLKRKGGRGQKTSGRIQEKLLAIIATSLEPINKDREEGGLIFNGYPFISYACIIHLKKSKILFLDCDVYISNQWVALFFFLNKVQSILIKETPNPWLIGLKWNTRRNSDIILSFWKALLRSLGLAPVCSKYKHHYYTGDEKSTYIDKYFWKFSFWKLFSHYFNLSTIFWRKTPFLKVYFLYC